MIINMSNANKSARRTTIGGQALIEGVMMKGPETAAMACRLPGGEIEIETWQLKYGKSKPWYLKTPFIRGSINFVLSLIEGYKCMMKSAEKQTSEDDEEEELTKFEKWLTEKFGDKLVSIIAVITTVLSLIFCICLFKFVPMLLASLLGRLGAGQAVKTVAEGIIKLALLVLYMWIISFTKTIRTTFQYHGAEHKTIACYEAGDELTPENVLKHTRFHPRCSTSFIMIVVLIAIIVGMFLKWDNLLVRFGMQLLLLPVEASLAFEAIMTAGKHDNIVTRIFSAPGLWLQRITTKEPSLQQAEVAIAAFKPCLPQDESEKA
jgi:uncharacterized protein YqhQ